MTDVIQDDRRTNWFWIDNEIVDRFGPQIGAHGLAIYAILARFANNKTRTAFPAGPTLAALSGLSRSTVLGAIKCLESTQPPLITVQVGGGRSANTYILNDLALAARDPVPTAPRPLPPSTAAAARSNGHYSTQPERLAPPTTPVVYAVDEGSSAPDAPQPRATQTAAARHTVGSRAPHSGHPPATQTAAARHTVGTPPPHSRHPPATQTAAARHTVGTPPPHAREQYSYNNTHPTPIEQDSLNDDDNDDRARVTESSSSSSSSSPASSEVSWESLEARYGEFEVRRAVEAAPEHKQCSVRYVAGILRNWEKEGTARPKGRRERRDVWAEREAATPAADDDDDAAAADETLPPPPPVRKAEVEDTRTPWERVLEHMRKFSPWYGFSTLEFVSRDGKQIVARMTDHPADSNNYRGGHEKVAAYIRDAWLKVNGEIVKVRVLPGEGPLVETGDDERKD